MSEDCKVVTIIFVQPILSTEPQEPLVILQDAKHRVLGKALLGGDMFKIEVLPR